MGWLQTYPRLTQMTHSKTPCSSFKVWSTFSPVPFSVLHDDGAELRIGSQTIFSSPGAVLLGTNTGTYTGPGGLVPFALAYGECCLLPAALQGNFPLAVPGPIVGAGLPGLIAACGACS